MDAYSPKLLDLGLKGMIGKGSRNDAVKEALKRDKAVYLGATGGAGALLSQAHRLGQGGRLRGPGSGSHPRAGGQGIPGGGHQRHVRRRPLRGRPQEVREEGGFLSAKPRETANVGAGLWKATGMWAWLFFRISGLVLVFYLGAHIIIISTGQFDQARPRSMKIFDHPVAVLLDLALVVAVLYHALNGVRIILMDFGDRHPAAQDHVLVAMAVVVICFVVFAYVAFTFIADRRRG